jgi:murein DD-endopeptidase MepM/ murein hydrolase activator NlpD
MEKMILTPSCIDSAEVDIAGDAPPSGETIALSEGVNRMRCPALISLAISMGATSLLMANQTQSAIAADVSNAETTSVEKTDLDPSTSPKLSLASPTLKHEVKLGETLWQLSQNYHVTPEAIAQANYISLQTELQIGQTIEIPAYKSQSSPRPEKISSPELTQSLINLKESRRKLQESLAALRSNQIVEQPTLIAEAPTSPQEETTTEVDDPIAEIDESSSLAIELNRPIPIIVPTPDINVSHLPPEPTLIPITGATQPSSETETTAVAPDSSEGATQSIPISVAPTEDKEINPEVPESLAVPSEPIQTPRLITATPEVYQVQPGDTLNTIANSHGIAVETLATANHISELNMIKVHQSLIIPSTNDFQSPTLVSKLPPVPQVKPVAASPVVSETTATITATTTVVTEPVEPSVSEQPKAVALAVAVPTQAPTEKLKAEVADLETYQTSANPPQVSVRIPIVETSPPSIRNWRDEIDNTNPVRRSQNVESRPTNHQQVVGERLVPSRAEESRDTIIGTAPIQVESYVDDLKIPVGTTVDPELPSLDSPDRYLPEVQPVLQNLIWPAKGVLSSGYGPRWGRIHRGIDIAAPVGTPIMAAASGEVISSGWSPGGYGYLVKVRHSDGSVTLYAHNSKLLVRKGQMVEQGQQISAMGSTGRSTGPHLHFEIHPNGRGAVNPIAYLPKKKK